MTGLLIAFILILLALYGTPLFVIIASIALIGFHYAEIDSMAIIIELYRMAQQPVLLAIPLFTFAGYLLAESKTPERLVNFSRALLGWMPGSLAIITLVSCAIFTAFTGASGVTIVALGGLLFPALLKDNYPKKFSLGMLTVSGNLGLLFPPSLPIILYGLVASTSIDKLFVAGILPGILMVGLLAIYSIFAVKKDVSMAPSVPFDAAELWKATKAAGWEIPIPFLILGGIYGGFFTATEAAAVMAFYVFVIEVFIYRDISLTKDLVRVVKDSMVMVGGILVILAAALGLANYFIDAEIPSQILEAMKGYIDTKFGFLMVLNIFLLIVGAMMDIFSAILVVVPLILPIAQQFGVDPVHLGVIFLANLGIGYSTPPVGMNLFIASFRFNEPVLKLYRATLPFLAILLITLVIITYWPELSLVLIEWFDI
ncbi:MAG: TRAP transporter large permease subunit [Calditrichaeota bacterium]|nr:MAG: TRAP transporter large permease [Calditrichota bacterium]MBL1204850.1 TRAP transporter large permease subunit [Calditrichota bacterium]NOG44679.1 TRAP transporter large permease subunit [Calditrichota bacterium]